MPGWHGVTAQVGEDGWRGRFRRFRKGCPQKKGLLIMAGDIVNDFRTRAEPVGE